MFSEDEDKSVDEDSDMDDRDDDDNQSGGERMEGNEAINDDERRDDKALQNIKDEDNAGIFDWNKIDAKIEQENRDRAKRVAVSEGEESNRSYSPTLSHDQSSKDIENDGNFNFSQNNNVVEHLNNENDTVVGDDNGDNNMTDRVDEVVAPIIQNSALHGRMEIGSSSNSIPTFDSNSVENVDSSRRLLHMEQMDTDSPSMTMAMRRNVKEDRGKGTIGTRIIQAARATVATVIARWEGDGRKCCGQSNFQPKYRSSVGENKQWYTCNWRWYGHFRRWQFSASHSPYIKCASMRTRRYCGRCDFFRKASTTSPPRTANWSCTS